MEYELLPRADRALARQHSRELERVYQRTDLFDAKISATGQVTRRAILEALETTMVRAQAERLARDGAEHYSPSGDCGHERDGPPHRPSGGEL